MTSIDLGSHVRPGDRIFVAQGVSEPVGLVELLREQALASWDVSVFIGFTISGLFDEDLARRVRLESYGAMADLAVLEPKGLLDVVPCRYSQLPGLIRDDVLRADGVLLQVTPPDAEGWCTTGLSMDYTVEAVRTARFVIAEVNDRLAVAPGAARIHRDDLTAVVEVSRPLPSVPAPEPGAVDLAIGGHVADLVPDGSTLQLGIGSTVTAIGRQLAHRRGLRVHSALAGDWLLDLDAAGALADDCGVSIVIGAAMGSSRLYEFVATDPRVELREIEKIQSAEVFASVPGLRAINSAIQVDLVGQVNVEVVGDRRISALGGHSDFLRGAQASPGGLGIVAMPATAGRKRVTRIVRAVDGGIVSTAQCDVDAVVTEHGTALLRGTTLAQRRRSLAAIADPEHRADLEHPTKPEATP